MPHEQQSRHAVDATLEYSRPFRALKLWLALPRARRRRVSRGDRAQPRTRRGCWSTRSRRHADLELLTAEPALSIVPFRHVPGGVVDLNAHNAQLTAALQRDGRVYVAPAAIDGHVYLRPCFVNYRTSNDDVRALVEVAREVGEALSAR